MSQLNYVYGTAFNNSQCNVLRLNVLKDDIVLKAIIINNVVKQRKRLYHTIQSIHRSKIN